MGFSGNLCGIVRPMPLKRETLDGQLYHELHPWLRMCRVFLITPRHFDSDGYRKKQSPHTCNANTSRSLHSARDDRLFIYETASGFRAYIRHNANYKTPYILCFSSPQNIPWIKCDQVIIMKSLCEGMTNALLCSPHFKCGPDDEFSFQSNDTPPKPTCTWCLDVFVTFFFRGFANK
ncbi:hypothetical protein Echvi_3970 [Echinicola vietnamensis DSM 17526]|uniref:Uncharacterized protein n=1 Tax=Echinicola vietnamensis (strain DSM 17526 / LMG 23754 / KMM 6221) TaxID=926556 RepID=L0G3S5_ECHVK|nr:hypothetical protein Echvi_3970 [Echinicola vietnamensis DSM 17526]